MSGRQSRAERENQCLDKCLANEIGFCDWLSHKLYILFANILQCYFRHAESAKILILMFKVSKYEYLKLLSSEETESASGIRGGCIFSKIVISSLFSKINNTSLFSFDKNLIFLLLYLVFKSVQNIPPCPAYSASYLFLSDWKVERLVLSLTLNDVCAVLWQLYNELWQWVTATAAGRVTRE